jgi:hypothetical protein
MNVEAFSSPLSALLEKGTNIMTDSVVEPTTVMRTWLWKVALSQEAVTQHSAGLAQHPSEPVCLSESIAP